MGAINNTGDRLRRATQLWHAYLASTGQRFDLAQFLNNPAVERQALDAAFASGDAKLVALAQDWLRDTGQETSRAHATRAMPVAPASPANPAAEPPKKSRYLKGVR